MFSECCDTLAAFLSQTIKIDNDIVKFDIWDTAGQERCSFLCLRDSQTIAEQRALLSYTILRVECVVFSVFHLDNLCSCKELGDRAEAEL